MKDKKHLQCFEINSINNKNEIIRSLVSVWIEKKENPIINDVITGKTYSFQGNFDVFFIEYKDESGRIMENNSDRLSNAFYGLCKKLEDNKLRMMVKGCSLGYYMIPRLQYSTKAVELKLTERVESPPPTVCIFDSEKDINRIVSVFDIEEHYKKWIESIKGISY